METITKKLQEMKECESRGDVAYDQYEKEYANRANLKDEIESMCAEFYLPSDSLKSIFPWITDNDVDCWKQFKLLYFNSRVQNNNCTLCEFSMKLTVRLEEDEPTLIAAVSNKERLKICLLDDDLEVNNKINDLIESIRNEYTLFILNSKNILNI